MLILLAEVLSSGTLYGQTSTVASGNWSTSGNWSSGVPGGGTNANVNHAMTLNSNISVSSGDYILYAPVTDATGGTAYTLSVSGNGGNQGNFDVRANTVFEGTAAINGNGTLTVRSGSTLTLGSTVFANNSIVVVEAGATLIINGDLTNNNNSTGITIHGSLIVNGDFDGGNGSAITGTGTFETTGIITTSGSGSVFGSTNDCSTGPCSGNNLCVSNTIGSSQTICNGQTPAGLTGSLHGGYTYQWQVSTTSSTTGFSDISGASGQNYSPGALSATSWYRRKVSSGGCTATSVAVQITVNANLPVSVSVSSNPSSTVCSGTNATFTATPVNGGTTPSYQWKLNGVNVGSNSTTYSNSGLSSGDIVTCVMTSNYSCPSGNPATSNSITMTIIPASGGWLGTTSSDWNNALNWCGGIPTNATDVTISSVAPNMPQISGAANCRNMTINSGASITLTGTGTLSATGNILNNGTFNSNGTITLNGASLQTIDGITSLNHLTINNASGASLSSPVTLLGILTLTSGQLTSNGNLTIDLNTGAISGTGSGSISGNITVTKTVNSAKYHYISSPLPGMTLAELDDDQTIKGGTYSNFYYYDETISDPDEEVGWTAITNTGTSLDNMKGYALYFEAAKIIDFTGTYNHALSTSNNSLTNTISADAEADGWNLVGNPYPSTIDWGAASGWTKTNIGGAIYFWDPVNDRYASYVGGIGTNGGTRYISPMQSFWVRVSTPGGSGTLGMNNNIRTTAANPSLWKVSALNSAIRLTVSSGIYSDETIVRFRNDATSDFDDDMDANKLMNTGTPSLFTKISGADYSINSLPDNSTEITIPLHLKALVDETYTLSAEDEAMFANFSEITLEDLKLDSIHDLKSYPEYTFDAAATDTTGRFLLNFKLSGITSSHVVKSSSKINIRSYENRVYIEADHVLNAEEILVYNILGKQVKKVSNVNMSSGSYLMELPGESGIYIVKVKSGGETVTEKVLLK